MKFSSGYRAPDDNGERAGLLYSLHRAWVEIKRDPAKIRVPAAIAIDLAKMANEAFAVARLGHATLLLRVGERWILIDPVFRETAGPVNGLGPKRLTRLPLAPEALPHIDLVLISHDHFDHLQLEDMRRLSRQAGGPPDFYAGIGLEPWFADHAGVKAKTFTWWQSTRDGEIEVTFVPAQHSSGRSLFGKDETLWGGWAIRFRSHCFYFAGDTAYVEQLFEEIHDRLGPIDVAAIPIGAYLPRDLMRHEHMDPTDAVKAHRALDPRQSFGVHWGTFQLGDEQPMDPSTALLVASRGAGAHNFGVIAIGAVIDITAASRYGPNSMEPPISTSVGTAPASR